MMSDPVKARKLILSQLEAFDSYDEDDFSRGWCRCDEDFREIGKQDPHCHVHRHVKTFLEQVEGPPGDVAGWVKHLEDTWCICHEGYKEIGREDPYCQVHTHANRFKLMVERALLGPHCKDCPGPYCPLDGRAYFPDDPDPKWECSWATTGIWPEREPEPPKEPSPMAKKIRAFLDTEFPDREKDDDPSGT